MGWHNTNEASPVHLRLFLYGPARSGKTTAAATFPVPLFFLPPNEDSIESLRGRGIRYYQLGEAQPGVKPVPLRDELESQIEILGAFAMKHGPQAFWQQYGRTIVVDQLTLYSDAVMAELQGDREKATDGNWGQLRTHFIRLRDGLWRLPAHIILTSGDEVKLTREGVVTRAGPKLQGDARDFLPGSTNLLGYMEQVGGPNGSTSFMCHFKKHGPFPAGARFGARMPPMSMACGDGVVTPTLYQQLAHAAGIPQ